MLPFRRKGPIAARRLYAMLKTSGMTDQDREPDGSKPRTITILGREFSMPRSRGLRIVIGVLLVVFGFLGFLPILGFWMVPLGLLVLSYEFAAVRRLRRRFVVWWERRGKRSAS